MMGQAIRKPYIIWNGLRILRSLDPDGNNYLVSNIISCVDFYVDQNGGDALECHRDD